MRHLRWMIVVLVLMALAPAAQARTTTKLKVASTISSIAPGNSGSYQAGDASGSLSGAVLVRAKPVTIVTTGNGVGTVVSFRLRLFTRTGSFSARGTLRIVAATPFDPANPTSGSQTEVGRGTITGGTARFRGARGRFTFTATSPEGQLYTQVRLRGNLVLP